MIDKIVTTDENEPKAKPLDVNAAPALRKKELIDLVVERSGIKKKAAKPVVEAMLEIIGETLSGQRELSLQPLGKIKVQKTKLFPNAKVYFTKVRQSTGVAKDTAEAADTTDTKGRED